jgi:cell wall-associated NlpC family hydrolase
MPARRLPLRRGHAHVLGCVLLTGLTVATWTLVSAARHPAAASPASAAQLQRRLEDLNAQADQQVEDYLQAQLALRRTRASVRVLQRQLDEVHGQLANARAGIAVRAALAYTHGPATDVASLLTARDPRQVLERAQLLELLAAQGSDALLTATAIERAARARAAELATVEQRQTTILRQLTDRRAAIQRLVSQTQQTLSQLRATHRPRAADPPSAPGSLRPPAMPPGNVVAVIRYAYAQLGKPYRWGAAGPDAFDCSGLTMMAWAQAGVSLPHSSRAQFGVGRQVSRAELRPGDLIFRNTPISHVALYVGNGMQVAATHTGSTVKQQSAWQGDIVGFSRPIG